MIYKQKTKEASTVRVACLNVKFDTSWTLEFSRQLTARCFANPAVHFAEGLQSL